MIDRTKVRLAIPEYKTDKIIGTPTGSLNVGAASGGVPATASVNINTGFGESCLFVGVFTTNGGATWNDMGANEPNLFGVFPAFQTVDCTAACSPTGVINVSVINYPNPNTGTAPGGTVQFKLALIAKKNQGSISPLPINRKIAYSSGFNYQKIHLDDVGSFSVAVGGTGQLPIPHNLGYIPNVRVWQDTGGTIRQVISQPEIRLDNSNLTFFYDNYFGLSPQSFNLIYRVYLDG